MGGRSPKDNFKRRFGDLVRIERFSQGDAHMDINTFEKIKKNVFTAKKQFKLAILLEKNKPLANINIVIWEATRNQQGTLIMVAGDGGEKISLNKNDYKQSVKILKKQAIYMISLYISQGMETCFKNRNNFRKLEGDNNNQYEVNRADDIWLICKWIRNGFAHNPINPKWYFEHDNDLKKELTVLPGIKLNARALHDKAIELGDFGGMGGLLHLCDDLLKNLWSICNVHLPEPPKTGK